MQSLFVPDGDLFVPTGHTRGPWDPRSQHGGPPSALLARCIEREPAPLPMEIARITVELMRPVPVDTPVRVHTRLVRPGRRVQLVEAVMETADGLELCHAKALRIRRAEVDVTTVGAVDVEQPPPPEQGVRRLGVGEGEAFAVTGVELRFVRGDFMERGPATVWIRLLVPLLPGEEPSGAQRACAAADFGNGVSGVYHWGSTLFINPDLSVHLSRMPVGEWICLEAITHHGTHGRGLSECRLFDTQGVVGRSLQLLFVEPM